MTGTKAYALLAAVAAGAVFWHSFYHLGAVWRWQLPRQRVGHSVQLVRRQSSLPPGNLRQSCRRRNVRLCPIKWFLACGARVPSRRRHLYTSVVRVRRHGRTHRRTWRARPRRLRPRRVDHEQQPVLGAKQRNAVPLGSMPSALNKRCKAVARCGETSPSTRSAVPALG